MAVTFSYLVSQHLKKIITVNHDIKGCRNLGQYCSKLPTDNITFSYLFRLTVLQHFKQIFIAVIRLHNFGSNLVQITQFPQEIFFGKIECYYCLPTVFYHATTVQKSPQMANHETRLHNFGSKWAQVVLSTKREFFWKSCTILL